MATLLGDTSVVAALSRDIVTRTTLDRLGRRQSGFSESVRSQIHVGITRGHDCIRADGSTMLLHFDG